MHAAGAGKGMVDAGVTIDFYIVAAGKRVPDFFHRLRGRVFILAGEVQYHRNLDPGRFIQILFDGYAIVADRAIDAAARCREISEPAAETESERTDFARHFRARAQRAYC